MSVHDTEHQKKCSFVHGQLAMRLKPQFTLTLLLLTLLLCKTPRRRLAPMG